MGRHSRTFRVRLLRAAGLCGAAVMAKLKYDMLPMHVKPLPEPSVSIMSRDAILEQCAAEHQPIYDVCIIGGGAVGLYAALDASTRGLRTIVVDANDFGGSNSTDCIGFLHGGFACFQKAIRQRDLSLVLSALDDMKDVTTWCNVAPDQVRRCQTVLPPIHSTENMELRWTARAVSALSAWVGPWCRGGYWRSSSVLANASEEQQEAGDDVLSKKVIVASDAHIDYHQAIIALASTCRRAGAHTLNYVGVSSVVPKGGRQLHEDVDGSNSRQPESFVVTLVDRNISPWTGNTTAPVTVTARTVVNCTGARIDSIRSRDRTAQLYTWRHENDVIPNGDTHQGDIVKRIVAHTFFAVPKGGLVWLANGQEVQVRDADGLVSLIASSSLKAHANAAVVPAGVSADDGFLVGTATSLLPDDWKEAEFGVIGSCPTAAQQRVLFRRVRQQLQLLGVDIAAATASLTTYVPMLTGPERIGYDACNQLFCDGYMVFPHLGPHASTSRQFPGMLHVVGGTIGNARRAAEHVVDRVVAKLDAEEGKQSSWLARFTGASKSRTRFIRLSHPRERYKADDHQTETEEVRYTNEVKRMVRDEFALRVADVVARRTAVSLVNPEAAKAAVPIIASTMQTELGWSSARRAEEERFAVQLLESHQLMF